MNERKTNPKWVLATYLFPVLILTIVVLGTSGFPDPQPGDVDIAFGDGGYYYSTVWGESFTSCLQADGKIILVGRTSSANGITLMRLNADGNLDGGFGTAGF